MLSYQHRFHAGNHGDVLKHTCLLGLLEKLTSKPKPFFFLDTHAGSARYTLGEHKQDDVLAHAILKQEHYNTSCLNAYREVLKQYLPNAEYPGSPLICNDFLCTVTNDISNYKLVANELHPSVFKELRQNLRGTSFNMHNRDAYELLGAMLPPNPNRGLVLIDPPYEQTSEYVDVRNAVEHALAKWPQGIIAIWYPLLSPTRKNRNNGAVEDNPKYGLAENMCEQIRKVCERKRVGLLDLQLRSCQPNPNVGMYGSGMLIVNFPYRFDELSNELLSELETVLPLTPSGSVGVKILQQPV